MTTTATLFARTAVAASCLLPVSAWALDDTARIRAIVDAAIRPVMAEHDVPGLAVGVTVAGRAYVFNYGVASKQANTPVGNATMFELGSVSKPIAATLVSYAQVLGKLSMHEHPSKYMAQLKGSPIDRATLLHLGTYTAGGLPLQFPDEVADASMTSYFQQWKPSAAPGAQRRYSNPSLGLFGHMAALAMKGEFADLVEQQLFAPLGMNGSFIQVPEAAMGNYAWGYNDDNQPVRMTRDVLSGPTYGVVANAADVLRFVQANIDPGTLPVPLRRAIEGTQVGYFEVGPMVQGLGWEQYRYPVKLATLVAGNSSKMSQQPNRARKIAAAAAASPHAVLFNKTGATGGFSNYVAFVPQKKIGVVMLANKFYPAEARIKAALAILGQVAPAAR